MLCVLLFGLLLPDRLGLLKQISCISSTRVQQVHLTSLGVFGYLDSQGMFDILDFRGHGLEECPPRLGEVWKNIFKGTG